MTAAKSRKIVARGAHPKPPPPDAIVTARADLPYPTRPPMRRATNEPPPPHLAECACPTCKPARPWLDDNPDLYTGGAEHAPESQR